MRRFSISGETSTSSRATILPVTVTRETIGCFAAVTVLTVGGFGPGSWAGAAPLSAKASAPARAVRRVRAEKIMRDMRGGYPWSRSEAAGGPA